MLGLCQNNTKDTGVTDRMISGETGNFVRETAEGQDPIGICRLGKNFELYSG